MAFCHVLHARSCTAVATTQQGLGLWTALFGFYISRLSVVGANIMDLLLLCWIYIYVKNTDAFYFSLYPTPLQHIKWGAALNRKLQLVTWPYIQGRTLSIRFNSTDSIFIRKVLFLAQYVIVNLITHSRESHELQSFLTRPSQSLNDFENHRAKS